MQRVPSPQRKAVVKHEVSVLGDDFDVNNYYNDNKTMSVELLTAADPDDDGLLSIATVGLSEVSLRKEDGSEFVTRVELCAGAPIDEKHWCNIVVSASFYIQRIGKPVVPGTVLENVIEEYFPGTDMPHVYLTVPFLWNDGHFPELVFEGLKINWLQCIAVSEAEKQFIYKKGSEAFEDLLAAQEVNILDSRRGSVSFLS